jgi:hypothetical protein
LFPYQPILGGCLCSLLQSEALEKSTVYRHPNLGENMSQAADLTSKSQRPCASFSKPHYFLCYRDIQFISSGNRTTPKDVSASLLYLLKDDLHKEIKPYKLQYDPGNSLPRTNTTNVACQVIIRDLRERLHLFSYDRNGFTVLDMESKLKSDDFYNQFLVESVYYGELKALLLEHFRAKRVEIMEHVVKRTSP